MLTNATKGNICIQYSTKQGYESQFLERRLIFEHDMEKELQMRIFSRNRCYTFCIQSWRDYQQPPKWESATQKAWHDYMEVRLNFLLGI